MWAWAVHELALLQGGNIAAGFLVRSVDVAADPPRATVSWEGATARIELGPDRAELHRRLGEAAPGPLEPGIDDRFFWAPDEADAHPLLVHAWVVQELARAREYRAASRRRGEQVVLRCFSGDAARIEVVLHVLGRGYAVRIPVEVAPPGSRYVGLADELAVTACADPGELSPAEPHDGIPTYRAPAR